MNRNRFAAVAAVVSTIVGLATSTGAFAAGQTHHEIRHIEHKMAVHHAMHRAVVHHRMAAAHRRHVMHHMEHHMEHHH